ncbi:MAG: glycosyltransferase family 2 protein [Saprospiraceae bacterium]
MPNPLVSIITVNYNQAEVTCALLESIRQQHYAAVEVIVVDNGSQPDPESWMTTRFPEIRYVRSEHNLGFAGGNNLGLPEARGEFLFFINNDAEVTEGCIGRLVDFLQQTPACGIVSPLLCYFPEPGQAADIIQYAGMTTLHPVTARNRLIGQGEPEQGQFRESSPTAYAHGAAMMIPRRVLDQVGPMSEDFFLYYEELDWCVRIRKAGYSIWMEPRARVYHKESLTVQSLGALKTYYLNRNRILFMRRHSQSGYLGLFYTYLGLILVPKNTVQLCLRREWPNLRAFWQGVLWNFGYKKNHWEIQNGPRVADPVKKVLQHPGK